MTNSLFPRVLRNFERMAVIRLVTRSARALNSIQTTQQTNKRVSTAMDLKKKKRRRIQELKFFNINESKIKQQQQKKEPRRIQDNKKNRKGKFSLNLRAQ